VDTEFNKTLDMLVLLHLVLSFKVAQIHRLNTPRQRDYPAQNDEKYMDFKHGNPTAQCFEYHQTH
jgi:hypothetical protein